jgi:RNA polymerase sigma-70 factor (ECF subfamily)
MAEPDSPILLDHLFRRQAGRIVSWLAGLLGPQHLQLAEDSVQEAMLRAMQSWPFQGIPEKPEAWLFRVAHNYAISVLRRSANFEQKTETLTVLLGAGAESADNLDIEQHLRDDELRMIFMCCHPELPENARVALGLQLVSGFSAGEIARIFLADEATIAQRIVRAKRQIRERKITLSMPGKTELRERLHSVLHVIYLMFSSGYAAHSGEELMRRDVCIEALRLGQLIAESSLAGPRVDALVALMALQASRLPARADTSGDLVLLEEQDRNLWDDTLIATGFRFFDRSIVGEEISEWHVQAAIAAEYAKAKETQSINWSEILKHFDQLMAINPSPVVALNRAVVVMKVYGAEAGLSEIFSLETHPSMRGYYLLPAVKGRMFMELGRTAEATQAFHAALACDCSVPERRFLEKQLASVQKAQKLKP